MINKTNCIAALLLACSASFAGAQQPANFVQILTDDQGWGDLGSYGHAFIQSPNIDRLAQEGIKFTACYSASGVCSPSRAAILTGRTPYRNGVYRWVPQSHFCYLRVSEITLPQRLRDAGYQTAHFGKWHLSHYYEERIGGSEQFENFRFGGHPDQPSMKDYGYDYWLATGNVARPSHKDPLNFFLNGKALGLQKGFSAQLVASEFERWLKEHRDAGQPFFATVWFHEPHGPIESHPAFMEPYAALKDPGLRQYYGNITQVDAAVGSIMQALEAAGVSDDTLIWYTSDNGPEGPHEFGSFNRSDSPFDDSRYRGSTGGLRGRKRAVHEGGIRVPGIIRWPAGMDRAGVRPGTVCDTPIIGSDVFATMLDIAGLPLPDITLDGTSIRPLLEGQPFKRPRPLYWRNLHYDDRIALREGDWKIVGNSERSEFALYNLRKDPCETTDLSYHEPERFKRMKSELIEHDRDVLAEGPSWWKREPAFGPMPVSD
jgi:arylsulfatase A